MNPGSLAALRAPRAGGVDTRCTPLSAASAWTILISGEHIRSPINEKERAMDQMATLTCPKCHGEMRSYERSGVVIDQCLECRGIFLDRGELLDRDARLDRSSWARPLGRLWRRWRRSFPTCRTAASS